MSRIYEEVDPVYAATCSDITLCSNSKGFFKGLADDLVSLAGEEWLNKFELVEDGKKVTFFMENKEVL